MAGINNPGPGGRKLVSGENDWISDFLAYTEGMASPEIYRVWSGISCLAGALERRVWLRAYEHRETFPNLYVLCVGAPGVGKQVIDFVRDLWGEVMDPGADRSIFHVAPDSVTKASLVDNLAKAQRTFIPPSGPPVTYHSLLIAAEEFEFFLPSYDREFISTLNKLFNNPTTPHTESRRTGSVRELSIALPQLNLLGGAQPAYFAATFPEEAWNTGLSRRILMIYAAETPFVELFQEREDRGWLRERLVQGLQRASQLWGQMKWESTAAASVAKWHREQEALRQAGKQTPGHSKLQHYVRSRTMHLLKLMTVSSVSRESDLVLRQIDFDRALGWLTEAERFMPDIFREMVGRSDAAVVEELHYFVQAAQARNRGKAIHTTLVVDFLRKRVPSEKIEKILWVAKQAGVLALIAGTEDLWVAKPKHDYGAVE